MFSLFLRSKVLAKLNHRMQDPNLVVVLRPHNWNAGRLSTKFNVYFIETIYFVN